MITALALLSHYSLKPWLKVQGSERLKKKLKVEIDVLSSTQEKVDAEVEIQLVVGFKEYYTIVLNQT